MFTTVIRNGKKWLVSEFCKNEGLCDLWSASLLGEGSILICRVLSEESWMRVEREVRKYCVSDPNHEIQNSVVIISVQLQEEFMPLSIKKFAITA